LVRAEFFGVILLLLDQFHAGVGEHFQLSVAVGSGDAGSEVHGEDFLSARRLPSAHSATCLLVVGD